MAKRKSRPIMVQSKAIAKNCLECAGETTKERLLCQIFDCPLWEWRLGCHASGNKYSRAIRAAFVHWDQDWEELRLMGIPKEAYLWPNFAAAATRLALGKKTKAKCPPV